MKNELQGMPQRNEDFLLKTSLRNIEAISKWPASWSSGQGFWLPAMRFRVRFPVLLWEFFLVGEDPHGDHGLGS
jgi:hypothetical protein